jgi:glutamate synthase domain-containing protein 2
MPHHDKGGLYHDTVGGCISSGSLRSVLNHIAIIPAQLYGSPPRDFLRESISTDLVLGENTANKPVKLNNPILLSGSPETYANTSARKALLSGAGAAGTLLDLGWYGFLPEEAAYAKQSGALTMLQMTNNRLGVDIQSITESDVISISLTHSGSGTLFGYKSSVLLPENLAPEIRKHLDLDDTSIIYGPPRLMDMDTPRDLGKIIQLVREVTAGEKPVVVRIGPGRVYNDIRIAVNAKPDGIILDCLLSSQTEEPAQSQVLSMGIPPLGVLTPMALGLKDSNAEKTGVKLIFTGDLQTASDIFKILAFGASGVMLSTAPLSAAGLITPSGEKSTGEKPSSKSKKGSASKSINIKQSSAKISSFLNQTLLDLKSLTAFSGCDSISNITTENLRATCYSTAAITGLKLMGYDKPLTMWEH